MKFAVLFSLLAWSGQAVAQSAESTSVLDIYYVPDSELEVTGPGLTSGQTDGDGFGLRTQAQIPGNPLVMTGAFQRLEFDGLSGKLDELRAGLGAQAGGGFGVYGEYVKLDFDGEDIDGWGAHARFLGPLGPQWQLSANLGWLQLDERDEDVSGTDIAAGLQYTTQTGGGFFAEYHILDLEGEHSGVGLKFTDLRFGLRLRY